jgi:energy-coupling factor transporter transmembrane protein EcfT
MWVLHFLPDSFILYIVYAAIALGVAGIVTSYVIRFVPFINIYRTPIQIVSILLLIAGIYWYGGYTTEMIWREEARKLQEKIDVAEAKAPVITKEIVYKTKEKILVVKRGVEVIKKEIEIKREIINEGCKLNPIAVEMYNKGVTGPKEETK